MKNLVKQYASTLLEGLVLAVAFAVVDQLRSNLLATASAATVGLVIGVFLGLGIAEYSKKTDTQE
ncbi:MAG: hypothetical protein H5T63_04750 [Chloroflexi bacterium]|nr:hypothetical protein [Chloroflexota bacterium]